MATNSHRIYNEGKVHDSKPMHEGGHLALNTYGGCRLCTRRGNDDHVQQLRFYDSCQKLH